MKSYIIIRSKNVLWKKKRYEVKLQTVQLKECLYRLPDEIWIYDSLEWPNIELPILLLIQTTIWWKIKV